MITTKDILSVSESGRVLHHDIDMLTAYRGFGYPGGVAHAFPARSEERTAHRRRGRCARFR
jgi:hypothetical protein